ncbi:MAG: hypothetical protein QOG53_608 [Frankiales bacterium]|jgi:uncharacterized protein (TIGR03084 family)|nr:hypothetical protein [Frankiales bacterium]
MDVFADLEAEHDRLDSILSGLDEASWLAPSAAMGWTIADVVLHLAQTDEMVVASINGTNLTELRPEDGTTLDAVMDSLVNAERADPAVTYQRWRDARRASVAGLRTADPQRPLAWAAAPLKPKALATTRIAEHWAHGLDITDPLGIPFPDTDRLRHIAWLAHRSLPYAFAFAGEQPHDVFCELTAPDGVTAWQYGEPGTESTIKGSAGAFCRVGAQRLAASDSDLETTGPHGATALRVLRNYAG